jgi:hypothetical protein
LKGSGGPYHRCLIAWEKVCLYQPTSKFYPTVEGQIYKKENTQMTDEQAPTVPAVFEVTLPKPDPQIEQELRAEIAQLQREKAASLAASEASLTAERLKTAREIAHAKPTEKVGNGMADLALQKAIAAVGGLPFWNRLSNAEKEAALNLQGGAQVKDSELKRLFGPQSSSIDANRLGKSNPGEYQRLRQLAKLRGIF